MPHTSARNFMLLAAVLCALQTTTGIAQLVLPVQWSTYLGGSGDDQMRDLCVDKDDNVYVCGVFTSPNFPEARGVPTSFDTSRANGGGYLASFSSNGQLRWLQYFGCVRPYEIAISSEGVLVMVGAVEPRCGNVDAIVATFTTSGERISRDRSFGGSELDIATSVDIVGNTIYVGGVTQSPDFPVTSNALQALQPGGVDGFVAKLDLVELPAGWQILPDVVTYFGGSMLDDVLVVRVRNTLGHVYIGGRTRSEKLPGSGFMQGVRLGTALDDDGFVARLDSTTLVTQWHTYCGGTGNEVVYGLQPYRSSQPGAGGEKFTLRVCGVYSGSPFPSPGNPASSAPFRGGSAVGGDGFLLQFSSNSAGDPFLITWNVSTGGDDVLCSFTRGNTDTGPLMFSDGFTVCGNTRLNAYRLNPYGNNQAGLSAFCGNNDEVVLNDVEQYRFGFGGIDEGPNSSYICGSTTSSVIPGTDAPAPILQRSFGGGRDGYLVKIGCGTGTSKIVASKNVLCAAGDTATLVLKPAASNVEWADGLTTSTRVINAPGTYRVRYASNGCSFSDSIEIKPGVVPFGSITPSDTIIVCDSAGVVLSIRNNRSIERVAWSDGAETARDTTRLVRSPGRYSAVIYSSDGCSATTDTVTVVSSSSSGNGVPLILSYAGADSADVQSSIRVIMRIAASNGTALESLPTDWSAVVRFNKTMLFPIRPLGRGTTDDSMRSIRISGRRKPTSDTLGFFDLRVVLGDHDSTSIIVDSLDFDPCYAGSAAAMLPFKTTGICRIDGVGRFVTLRRAKLAVAVVSNPVGSEGAIGSAVGDDARLSTARIVTMLGEQIHLGTGSTDGESVEWVIPSRLTAGTYVFVVQSPSAVATTLFEVAR